MKNKWGCRLTGGLLVCTQSMRVRPSSVSTKMSALRRNGLRFLLATLAGLLWATWGHCGNPLPDSKPDPGASYGTFRLAHDSWGKHMVLFGSESHYAFTDHGLGSFGLYQYFYHNRKNSKWRALEKTLALGILWEVKDGFVPYEKYGKWGGEGFSKKDVVRDLTGIGSAMLFNYLTEKRKK